MDERATRLTQSRYDRQAALFDLTEAPSEFLVFGRMRKRLWDDVDPGRLLEVGVGTGKNMRHYPAGARAVAIDLSPRMVRKAQAKARRLGRDVDLVVADAQRLPFRDGVFDIAAATFVFCSVPDPIAGLSEVRRVVRDGGRVDLLEHVRARFPVAGRLMDLLNPLVVRMTGANINRDTVANVGRAGIDVHAVSTRFGIIKLIRGRPARSAAASASAEGEQGAVQHVA